MLSYKTSNNIQHFIYLIQWSDTKGKIIMKIYCRKVFESMFACLFVFVFFLKKKIPFTWVNISYNWALIYEKEQWTAMLITNKSLYLNWCIRAKWLKDWCKNPILFGWYFSNLLANTVIFYRWHSCENKWLWKLFWIWNGNNDRRTKSNLRKCTYDTRLFWRTVEYIILLVKQVLDY